MEINSFTIKGQSSLYRSIGLIGSVSTLLLSALWTVLCLIGLLYYLHKPPYDKDISKNLLPLFGSIFSNVYFSRDEIANEKFQVYLRPHSVAILIFIYLLLSINLIVGSILAFNEFHKWSNRDLIKTKANYWCISAISMGLYEFIFAILFYTDYISIQESSVEAAMASASALTMTTIGMKGYYMWAFQMSLCVIFSYMQFYSYSLYPL